LLSSEFLQNLDDEENNKAVKVAPPNKRKSKINPVGVAVNKIPMNKSVIIEDMQEDEVDSDQEKEQKERDRKIEMLRQNSDP
jgi:hypothetical protein